MPVAKITEISATSSKSFEDAIKVGLKRAEKTLRSISGVWVKSFKVDYTKGKISSYRVLLKVTFILNVNPGQDPADAPNFYNFDDDVLYAINVDNNRDEAGTRIRCGASASSPSSSQRPGTRSGRPLARTPR